MRPLLLVAATWALLMPASAAGAPRHPLPPPAPVADDALTRALERGRLSEAQYALERARSLFRLRAVRRDFGDVARPDPHDATFILRDLALRVGNLSPSEQHEATALLARPDDRSKSDPPGAKYERDATLEHACDPNMCFHWDSNTANADASETDWVTRTISEFQNVWTEETVTLGYREPLPDSASVKPHGPDGKLDIYLLDLGAEGLFGYCTIDPRAQPVSAPGAFDFAAYCAVDNDFDPVQYDSMKTALQLLQATAAHEFFHAVQFAYDAGEDIAFMEQTAMWIEDEVYDDVNDSRRYLRRSALTNPLRPIDYGANGYQYGNWIFWRFLSERYEPDIVRAAWQHADGSAGGRDDYSIQAVRRELKARGTSLHAFLARFGRANRRPAVPEHYEEGTAYPAAPLSDIYRVGPSRPTGWKSPRLDHLTNRYYAFKPRRSVPPAAKLRVKVDLPAPRTKPLANLVVFFKSGAVKLKPIALDSAGKGRRRVPFGRGQVKRVELVLTNGSSRFSCWAFTLFACQGEPRDDRRTYAFKAVVK